MSTDKSYTLTYDMEEESGVHKGAYESPKLIEYGSLASLTQAGTGKYSDSGVFNTASGVEGFTPF